MSKAFTTKALQRILEQVPRIVAIGSIIKAEQSLKIRTRSELDLLVEEIINVFLETVPNFVVNFISQFFPGFFSTLSLFVAGTFYKYLSLLPGDVLDIGQIDIGPSLEEPPDYVGQIEELESIISIQKSDIEELESDIEELESNITILSTENSSLQQKISSLSTNKEILLTRILSRVDNLGKLRTSYWVAYDKGAKGAYDYARSQINNLITF